MVVTATYWAINHLSYPIMKLERSSVDVASILRSDQAS